MAAQKAAAPDLCVGLADLLDAQRVHHRVDGRVGMRQEDAGVEGPLGDGPGPPGEEQHAVHDVQRHPAHREDRQHQRQGAGQPALPLVEGPGGRLPARGLPPQTHAEVAEDQGIEQCHGQQGQQDAAKVVEVDHVGQGDHGQEGALDDGGVGRGGRGARASVVPAKERREAEQTGDEPAEGHCSPGAALSGHALVSATGGGGGRGGGCFSHL